MNIPQDMVIAKEKIREYLLRPRPRNDKSRLLGGLGFSADAPGVLEEAIRRQTTDGDATMDKQDVYGDYFVVAGPLVGPAGSLMIESVWIRRAGEEMIRFVTLKPVRSKP